MTEFEVGGHVKFAGGQGEITKVEDRPNGGQILHVYVSGAGEAVTVKLVPVYVTLDGNVSMAKPEIVDTLPPEDSSHSEMLDQLASMASDLHSVAEMEVWDQVESFAEEARQEREREVEIKRQHAERHFDEQIGECEERLETYKQQDEQVKDMSAPIGNAKRQLESLRRERDEELAQLEEEKHVTPEEPERVTAALIQGSVSQNR